MPFALDGSRIGAIQAPPGTMERAIATLNANNWNRLPSGGTQVKTSRSGPVIARNPTGKVKLKGWGDYRVAGRSKRCSGDGGS